MAKLKQIRGKSTNRSSSMTVPSIIVLDADTLESSRRINAKKIKKSVKTDLAILRKHSFQSG